jgi:hypothetical protein
MSLGATPEFEALQLREAKHGGLRWAVLRSDRRTLSLMGGRLACKSFILWVQRMSVVKQVMQDEAHIENASR